MEFSAPGSGVDGRRREGPRTPQRSKATAHAAATAVAPLYSPSWFQTPGGGLNVGLPDPPATISRADACPAGATPASRRGHVETLPREAMASGRPSSSHTTFLSTPVSRIEDPSAPGKVARFSNDAHGAG